MRLSIGLLLVATVLLTVGVGGVDSAVLHRTLEVHVAENSADAIFGIEQEQTTFEKNDKAHFLSLTNRFSSDIDTLEITTVGVSGGVELRDLDYAGGSIESGGVEDVEIKLRCDTPDSGAITLRFQGEGDEFAFEIEETFTVSCACDEDLNNGHGNSCGHDPGNPGSPGDSA